MTKKSGSESSPEDASEKVQEEAPLFASYQALNKPQSKNRKQLWLLISLVLLLFLAQQTGVFAWYCFRADSETRMQLQLTYSYYTYSQDKYDYTEGSKYTDFKDLSYDKSYGMSTIWVGDSNLFADLEEQLQADLKKDEQVSAEVVALELNGLYWLPLYKSGHCKYQLNVRGVGSDSIVYVGGLAGETDFSVVGTCPINKLRNLLSKKISELAIKTVRSDIKKRT